MNFVPAAEFAAALPLERGKMNCLTCHREATPAEHQAARKEHDPLLRLPAEQLCASCHANGGKSASMTHAARIQRGHWNMKTASSGSGLLIDAESQRCLTCHDGSAAKDVAFSIENVSMGENLKSHPLGIMYKVSPNGPPLASPSSLDTRVQLADGKLACASCHSPYSRQKKLLVISNLGSALCLSCHRE